LSVTYSDTPDVCLSTVFVGSRKSRRLQMYAVNSKLSNI